jgi:RNA polymerase sigma-70 factor, ECF subfamily
MAPGEEEAEERLIGRARELDEAAWATIYQRHAPQVYAYIYFRIGDQHVAEDLTSDVFVRAVNGIKRYSYRGTPLLAWLYRIAHNVTADHRKSAAKHAARTAPGVLPEVEETRDDLRARDEREDMLAAIRRLTPDQQQVVILRFYRGMSSAEVAAVIGKPEGAVKALQTRAVRALRRIIEA